MRITINLATRPFADVGPILKRLRIAMAVFALVSIGLGTGLYLLHQKAVEARARNHSLDGDIARITHERQNYEALMRQPDNAQVLAQVGNLNRLFDEKAFSWTLAMEDLETVLPGGVQVTTLEPIRDKEGRITLRLRVVGPRDKAVEVVQNLEHSRHFIRPAIVGESSENTGLPGQQLEPVSISSKVSFEMVAEYNPATLSEPAPAAKKPELQAKPKAPASATGTAHATLTPAGPGLRRPPFSGVSRPQPAVSQPGVPRSPAAVPQPGAPHPQAAVAQPNPPRPKPAVTQPVVPLSPSEMRQAGQHRYPAVVQIPEDSKPHAGGPK
jgi:type IV pilus assembly protein PilN